jgi:hypothetical protein
LSCTAAFCDAGQSALDSRVGHIGQLRLHVAQHGDGVFALVRRANAAIVEDAHQLAQQALVADDLDVALDVEVARNALGEECEICRAADGIQLAPPGQLFLNREVVDALALGHQINDGAEDALVRVEGKILGLQLLGRVADGDAVQQHRAEDGDFGVNGGRQAGHFSDLCECSHSRNLSYSMRPCALKVALLIARKTSQ